MQYLRLRDVQVQEFRIWRMCWLGPVREVLLVMKGWVMKVMRSRESERIGLGWGGRDIAALKQKIT